MSPIRVMLRAGIVLSLILAVSATWWWALHGMAQPVAIGWSVTVVVLGLGCLAADDLMDDDA